MTSSTFLSFAFRFRPGAVDGFVLTCSKSGVLGAGETALAEFPYRIFSSEASFRFVVTSPGVAYRCPCISRLAQYTPNLEFFASLLDSLSWSGDLMKNLFRVPLSVGRSALSITPSNGCFGSPLVTAGIGMIRGLIGIVFLLPKATTFGVTDLTGGIMSTVWTESRGVGGAASLFDVIDPPNLT